MCVVVLYLFNYRKAPNFHGHGSCCFALKVNFRDKIFVNQIL